MSSGRDSPAITEEESYPDIHQLRRSSSASSTGGPPPTLRRSSTSRARKLKRLSSDSAQYDLNLPTIDENRTAEQQNGDEQLHWHSFSLLFVAVPAFCGLFFENGGAVATDAGLLGLGCLFLYWSVKWPWQWYNAARIKIYVDYDPELLEDEEDFAAVDPSAPAEEDGQEQEQIDEDGKQTHEANSSKRRKQQVEATAQDRKKAQAGATLMRYELMALFWCFAMPMAVAWLLHLLRPHLSRPSGGLVSNSNLTLFILAAEIRPIVHIFKLIDRRTMHLQKIVSTPELDGTTDIHEQVAIIIQRLESAEGQIADVASSSANGLADRNRDGYPSDKSGVSSPTSLSASAASTTTTATAAALAAAGSATQTLQPQLDALNRAVRRYEKRATMQSVILDARLRDLDNRVSDALTLAAAASRMSHQQQYGLGSWALEFFNSMVANALKTMWALIMLPWSMTQRAYMYLLGPRRKRRVNNTSSSGNNKGKAPARWEYEKAKRITST